MKQLKILSIVWGMLIFTIFIVLTIFALKWKSTTDPYFKFEDKLVNITKSYYESEYSYPQKGESKKININELKEKELIDDLKVNDDTCEGFVLISYNNVVEFKSYIKCSNYTTVNYDKYK